MTSQIYCWLSGITAGLIWFFPSGKIAAVESDTKVFRQNTFFKALLQKSTLHFELVISVNWQFFGEKLNSSHHLRHARSGIVEENLYNFTTPFIKGIMGMCGGSN